MSSTDSTNSILYRYGYNPTTHDVLKAFAVIVMIVDHVGWLYFPDCVTFRTVGRLAAPLFFFLVGYSGKYRLSWELYISGLLLSALVFLAHGFFAGNILLSFLAIRWLFQRWDPDKSSTWFLILLFVGLTPFYPILSLMLEYGQIGLFWAIGGRLVAQNNNHLKWWLPFTAFTTFFWNATIFPILETETVATLWMCECVLLWAMTRYYKLKTWNIWETLRVPTLALSRYSLRIYSIHLALFLLVFIFFFKTS
jgi:hypothetical protein